MRAERALGAFVAVVAVGAALLGTVGVARAQAEPPDTGICARCHDTPTALAVTTGGHARLACAECHADRRPGHVGRRHRAVPRCADCHPAPLNHPPRAKGAHATGRCVACHAVHGSTNLELVATDVRRRGRLAPVRFLDRRGAAPAGFTDPTAPGTGVCETCHRQTDFYRADGTGEPHFTATCTLCHAHERGFAFAVDDASCHVCHAAEAARFEKPSLHRATFGACSPCHAERDPVPGPGHRAVTPCRDCHDTATHAPPIPGELPCAQCHEPHGTDNLNLVREAIQTPQGDTRPVVFTNLLGRLDGSFASASAPGTGVCEICHTQTRFYRADGTGESHFAFSCLPCHLHGDGFRPTGGLP